MDDLFINHAIWVEIRVILVFNMIDEA